MKTGRIPYTDFVEDGKRAVLDALDEYMQKTLDFDKAKGWRDTDLPHLLPAIEAHFQRIAERFNAIDSKEEGSACVKFFDL